MRVTQTGQRERLALLAGTIPLGAGILLTATDRWAGPDFVVVGVAAVLILVATLFSRSGRATASGMIVGVALYTTLVPLLTSPYGQYLFNEARLVLIGMWTAAVGLLASTEVSAWLGPGGQHGPTPSLSPMLGWILLFAGVALAIIGLFALPFYDPSSFWEPPEPVQRGFQVPIGIGALAVGLLGGSIGTAGRLRWRTNYGIGILYALGISLALIYFHPFAMPVEGSPVRIGMLCAAVGFSLSGLGLFLVGNSGREPSTLADGSAMTLTQSNPRPGP